MSQLSDKEREHALTHLLAVFSVSSAMVGVCLTAISLILVVEKLSAYRTLCDTLLMGDMFLFLGAAILSYIAFRKPFKGRWRYYHATADVLTLVGLVFMAFTSVLLVLALF